MKNKVFIDANIFLDYFLERKNFNSVDFIFENKSKFYLSFYTSISVVSVLIYFTKKNKAISEALLNFIIDYVEVIDGNKQMIVNLYNFGIKDYEDSLNYQIAVQHNLDYFLTEDKYLLSLQGYKIPIMSLEKLALEVGRN